jgi:diguanylate cyclase (GGDEF)-like protein
MVGTSYQTRPLDELILMDTECFDAYMDVIEKGDYNKIRRFIEKISQFRAALGFKLAEVQHAFSIFKVLIWELIRDEEVEDIKSLIDFFIYVDSCVNSVIFELSEVYQRKVKEEIEKHISNIEDMNQRLARLSITDGLTGLYNHRYFHETLEREFKKYLRYKTIFSVCMFDLDDFKKINDKYGHLYGDEVLRKFANIMRECSREIDMNFRYGGEEFSSILVETGKEGGVKVAERIRNAFEKTEFIFNNEIVKATVSCGVSSIRPDITKEELLNEVDSLLYKAKQTGKNKVCY